MNPTLNVHLSRRQFIKTGAAGTASLGLGLSAFSASGKKIPIGLQLWSIREECKKDLPTALKTVAEIGYQGLEFAGSYDLQAKELRKMLDDHGLVCCGTHTPLEACEKVGGTEWYIVEDERGGDALDTVRRCYEGMKNLGRA